MAYLEAINGPDPGLQYPLDLPTSIVGRHPECDIVVDVGAVSRQHAEVTRADGKYFIKDLKSRNGTFINDQPIVSKVRLRNGDTLQVCDVSMVFHDDAPVQNIEDSSYGAMLVDDEPSAAGSTIMSKLEVGTGSGLLTIAASAEAKLNALVEINQNLGKRVGLDEVLPQVLESLFAIFVQADRGFIILKDETDQLIPRWTKLRREDKNDTLRISKTIVNQVIDAKEAVLSADAASDSRFEMSQSIADFRIRSMMCAPLIDSDDNAFGVLQIDTLEQRKRFQAEDLEVLASVAAQAGIAINNAQLHEAALAQRALQRDLELATQVQLSFLPTKPPTVEGYAFFDFYQAANKVGGDYYDYIELADGRIAIVVADVVGHGVAAALLMARLSSHVRVSLARQPSAAQALTEVNHALAEIGVDDRFVTLVLGILDPQTHEITIANAGHNPPLHRDKPESVIEIGDEATGLPLGVLDDFEYDEFTLDIKPGQVLTMYTDGISEAMDVEQEIYTIERMQQVLAQSKDGADQVGPQLMSDVKKYVRGASQNDDMCIVCLGRPD